MVLAVEAVYTAVLVDLANTSNNYPPATAAGDDHLVTAKAAALRTREPDLD